MHSPVHSGRIAAPTPRQTEDTPSTSHTPSTSQRQLAGPGELSGRPPSSRLAGGDGQRLRQSLHDSPPPTPEHARGPLLRHNVPSERWSEFEEIRLSSGRTSIAALDSSRLDSNGTDPGAMMDWLHNVAPPEPPGQGASGLDPRAELQPPEPRRSWMSVGAALASGLKKLASAALNEGAVTLGIARLPNIPKHLVGALAGHSIHQSIAVGIPTFLREMVGIGVMHALRAEPPSTAVALQASMGVANLLIQGMREFRELRRPDEAARAYFSLSAEEWAGKSAAEQDAMKLHHRRMSRAITVIQIGSSITNLSLMVHNFAALHPGRNPGFAGHDHTAALRPLGNEIKVGVYAALRDGIQASFSMVGFKPSPTAAPGHEFAAGMRGTAHAASAATYAAANSASSFLGDALMGAWVPDRGAAISTLMGNPATGLSHAQAWLEVAKGAGVSAMANTLAETIDWFQRTQHFVNETGATQHWEPALTGQDYGRLLDQAPARAAAFNGIFSALTLAGGEMGKSDLPPAVQQFIGNVGLGVMIAMLDSPVSGIWQAEEAVRQATRPATSATIEEIPDVEAGGVHGEGRDHSGEMSGSDASGGTRMSAGNPPERHHNPPPAQD